MIDTDNLPSALKTKQISSTVIMKSFIVIAAFLALIAAGSAGTINDKIECLRLAKEARIGESTVRKILEDLRAKLTKFDPLDVTDHHTTVNNGLISLDSVLSAQSSGLSGFLIEKLSLSLIGLNLKLQLRWPEVVGKGSYNVNLNSTLFPQNIVGDGDFDVLAKNFVFKAEGKLSVSIIGMNIQIKSMTIDMQLEDFALKMSGLMFDDELSEKLSNYLSENLPQLLVDSKDKINQILKDNLHIINDMLAGKKYFSSNEMARLTTYLIACGEYD